MNDTRAPKPPTDFIRQIVAADVESDRHGGRVVTRFPPEPNGYLHIGHAKSICLNFGLAREFGGTCHLRFDDTNPDTEREEFVRSIQANVRWLGFDWGEHLYFASDYFERMYECAVVLIEKGLAYVDSQPLEAIREGRGSVTEPGVASPYRDRSTKENHDLFRRMRLGEFDEGAHVLRAKIDMASPNMLMRDPVLYRIRKAGHYRQGDEWCIYPLYDYAHCLEDAFEGITHSICTLEFENNRELYDWVLDAAGFLEPRTHQYEFARLELEDAVLSKRRIIPLVENGVVSGWDDPRLATISAIRRRGVPPEAVRLFCDMIGVAKSPSVIEASRFDFAVREVLNQTAPRVMAVLDPLKVVLTNYPEGESETFDAPYFPHDVPREGSRPVPFSREVWIERDDFAEDPPKGFRRLVPGGEVRLRYAYVVRCDEVVKDADGRVVELRCTYDPESRGGDAADGRKIKGTIQWVSVRDALSAEVRLFEKLFLDTAVDPDDTLDVEDEKPRQVNPDSLTIIAGAKVEPSLAEDDPETRYQFERTGYFWRDPVDGRGDSLVFNRIVALKDTWTKRDAPAEPKQDTKRKEAGRARPSGQTKPREGGVSGAEALSPEARARAERLQGLGVAAEHADFLAGSEDAARFFEDALSGHADAATIAAWIVVDLRGLLGERSLSELPVTGADVGRLAALVGGGVVSRRAGKDVLAHMVEHGGDPAGLVESMGLAKVSDAGTLGSVVEDVLAAWPDKVREYHEGRRGLIGLFVGEVMKSTGGAADPAKAKALIAERLEDEKIVG